MTASESASAPSGCGVSVKSPLVRCATWSILVQSEIGTEVNPLDVLVRRQAFRRTPAEDRALVHDVGAIGDLQRLPHVVISDQDTDATVLQVHDDLLDICNRDGIDAGKWF